MVFEHPVQLKQWVTEEDDSLFDLTPSNEKRICVSHNLTFCQATTLLKKRRAARFFVETNVSQTTIKQGEIKFVLFRFSTEVSIFIVKATSLLLVWGQTAKNHHPTTDHSCPSPKIQGEYWLQVYLPQICHLAHVTFFSSVVVDIAEARSSFGFGGFCCDVWSDLPFFWWNHCVSCWVFQFVCVRTKCQDRVSERYQPTEEKKGTFLGNLVFFCSGCFVWALVPFFVLLRCFLSMAKRKPGRGICVSSFGFGVFCCACVIRFAVFLMRPVRFMLNFFHSFVCLIPMLEPANPPGQICVSPSRENQRSKTRNGARRKHPEQHTRFAKWHNVHRVI